MSLVFVSYARKDADFVNRLAADLRAQRVSLWIDREALPGGTEWLTALENALEDATHLLLVLSPASNRSKFVKRELLYALEEGKRVIPIRIEDCKPPLIVRDLQYIDFVSVPYPEALKRLLAALPQSRGSELSAEPAAARHARFWAALQAAARPRTRRHDHLKPPGRNTLEASAGVPGLRLRYVLHRQDASAELVIQPRAAAIFAQLHTARAAIEAAYGAPLRWEAPAMGRAGRISAPVLIASLRDEANWPAAQEALIDAMLRLEAALHPHLDGLTG